uniref:Uncharacterized protein n=1 Tax=Mustela putorius furo TaxID=9669 RepID=M3YRA4_MUSPF
MPLSPLQPDLTPLPRLDQAGGPRRARPQGGEEKKSTQMKRNTNKEGERPAESRGGRDQLGLRCPPLPARAGRRRTDGQGQPTVRPPPAVA